MTSLSPTLIIGTGLVGASVGAALTSEGVEVHLSDAVPAHAAVAASLGAGSIDPIAPEDVALVVVAVPPDHLATVIADALVTYPNAVVTDVGSVKGTVIAELRARGVRELDRYCGGHPMAGSHLAGPLTARADLFVDRTWVVTPHETASAASVLTVAELGRTCHARVMSLGPAHHDEAVAQVSHVPQLLSTVMGETLVDVPPEHLRLAGQGVRDVTRIAGGDPELWRQIIGANRHAVRTTLLRVQASLDELVDVLDREDCADDLEAILARGRDGARAIPGKHGAPSQEFAHVRIEIPDAPGALARLFADIEAAGVNVEDLSIEHDDARAMGWLDVHVAPERESGLRTSIAAAGWTIRS